MGVNESRRKASEMCRTRNERTSTEWKSRARRRIRLVVGRTIFWCKAGFDPCFFKITSQFWGIVVAGMPAKPLPGRIATSSVTSAVDRGRDDMLLSTGVRWDTTPCVFVRRLQVGSVSVVRASSTKVTRSLPSSKNRLELLE